LRHLGHSFTSEFNDDEDIINGCSNFVRYTNNSLCYFRKIHPFVQYKLFQAYCASLYGCELWLLTINNIDALRVAWRKALRIIWNLPSCTYSRLLPLICECLPLFDEICRRSLNLFARTCALHDSLLIRSVAQYGAIYARSHRQKCLFCVQRYHRSISDVIYNPAHSFIDAFVYNSVDFETHTAANLLTETLMLRDHVFYFPNVRCLMTN